MFFVRSLSFPKYILVVDQRRLHTRVIMPFHFASILSLLALSAFTSIWYVSGRDSPEQIRANLHEFTTTGRMKDVIAYLDQVEKDYGTLLVDDVVPSLYSYRGVALYNGLKVHEAANALKLAVQHFPKDTRSWINLGEMQVQTFQLDESYESFSSALKEGDMAALPRALRTKGWAASWQNFEYLSHSLEREVGICLHSMADCRVDSAGGLEYCDVDGKAHVLMNSLNPNSMPAKTQVEPRSIAPYWSDTNNKLVQQGSAHRRLKVGFMSSDFGVHPVAQLVRGLFQSINTSRLEVFCFALQPQVSWWGQNISETVEHFVWLQNMNTLDAAREIARLGVEVLIDLNGHTMHSGLTIMTHRPAPVQMSFLGLPTTTSAPFIDYYIADSVAVPPEQRHQYSEQLLLMSDCYIANDYAQIQGDILKFTNQHRAPRSALGGAVDLSKATFLFATLSNSQKMDPEVFQVWMNILQRFAGSKMVVTEHAGKQVYVPHLQKRARGFGVATDRLVSLPQAPWIDHLYAKTSIDLVLDTIVKNGHTTGLDGIWAGIPTISLAGGQEAPRRAAESIAVTLDSTLGLAYSLKEYEDLAFALARSIKKSKFAQQRAQRKLHQQASPPPAADQSADSSPLISASIELDGNSQAIASQGKVKKSSGRDASKSERLRLWRKHIDSQRTVSNLFDMPSYEEQFTRLLQGSWELSHIAAMKHAFKANSSSRGGLRLSKKKGFMMNNVHYNAKGLFHMFTPVSDRYRHEPTTEPSLASFEESSSRSKKSGKKEERPRRWNRDAQNRIIVSQTSESAGSMTDAALQKIEHEQAKTEGKVERKSTRTSTPTKSAASNGRTTTHKEKENDTSAAEEHQRPGGPRQTRKTKRYPPLPRYIFDGRLIMLNIGKTFFLLLISNIRLSPFSSTFISDFFCILRWD